MAGNGGIIGPVNTVGCASTQPARVTTFTASSCTVTTKAKTTEIDYLVVAGGGTGSNSLGGGGAGGYRTSFPGGTKLTVTGCTPYGVTIGAGGAHTTPVPGACWGVPGNPSIFNPGGSEGTTMISATGGSGGIQINNPAPNYPAPGGSGGGGVTHDVSSTSPSPLGNAGSYTPVEGYPGGPIVALGYVCAGYGNGGGGASEAGNAGTYCGGPSGPGACAAAGAGGDGLSNSISGGAVTYAGGGGGSSGYTNRCNPGAGGAGGGTAGGNGSGGGTGSVSAAANTGGGSGAQGMQPLGYGNCGTNNGGSGIIIIKEPQVCIEAPAPGVWSMNTVYDYVKRGKWV